jgi:hypothetical protein
VKKRPRCVPVEKRTITSRSVQSEAGFRSSPVLAYGALRSDIGHRSSSGVSIRPSPSPRNKVNNAPNPEGYGIASRSSSIYSHKRASLSTPMLRPDTVVMRDVLKFPSFLLGEEDTEALVLGPGSSSTSMTLTGDGDLKSCVKPGVGVGNAVLCSCVDVEMVLCPFLTILPNLYLLNLPVEPSTEILIQFDDPHILRCSIVRVPSFLKTILHGDCSFVSCNFIVPS